MTDQFSLLEVERERLEITLSPGLHIICGTRSPNVSGILQEKMLRVLRICLIGGSGHSYDRNARKSNSLCDHYNYRGVEFKRVIENINIA